MSKYTERGQCHYYAVPRLRARGQQRPLAVGRSLRVLRISSAKFAVAYGAVEAGGGDGERVPGALGITPRAARSANKSLIRGALSQPLQEGVFFVL